VCRFAAWLLAIALLPSLAFASHLGPADSGDAGASEANSFASAASAGDTLRQCLPDTATCDDLPAASAAAILDLNDVVIAAVAGHAWTAVTPPPALVSRDLPAPPEPAPPRS
jgi:hypothetical protein